ncbi:MAG: substrate-binding domain-containing protein [Candidatus Aminicenantales bacterium]
MSKRRWTIGLINDTPNDPNSAALWEGAGKAAAARDATLICFPAGAYRSPRGFDAQANVLYDLAGEQSLDGMVFWSSLLRLFCSYDETRDFLKRYGRMPVVAVASPIEGVPVVKQDGFQGMRDAVLHLIKRHRLRKIAFIRGPETHPEAEDRFRAYRDALAVNNIPFNPALVAPGDFKKGSGSEAVRLFYDERKLKPEAIVAANDVMAIDAMEALQDRGIRVPHDVSVVGYDDLLEARQTIPSLTTVRQSFFEQARKAVEMVLDMLDGKTGGEDLLLPSKVIIRQSCSCLDRLVVQAGEGSLQAGDQTGLKHLAAAREAIREEMALASDPWPGFADTADGLLAAFLKSMESESEETFLHALADALRRSIQAGLKPVLWHSILSAMRRNALPFFADGDLRNRAENLFQQARTKIGETVVQEEGGRWIRLQQETKRVTDVSQMMISMFDRAELLETIAREFPGLGIGRCYLSVYEDPADPLGWARLILAFDGEGRRPVPDEGIRFPAPMLVPEGMRTASARADLIVEPLYFRREQIGFVVFNGDPLQAVHYDRLRGVLSSALKGEALVRGIEQRSAELAKAYTDLKDNQQKLLVTEKMASLGRLTAGIAHEMNTPLAAVRAAIKELTALVGEYRLSVGNDQVLVEDHLAIADDMIRNLTVAGQAAEKSAGFIRGIKAQTIDMTSRPQQSFHAASIIRDTLNLLEFALRKGQCRLDSAIDDSVYLFGDPRSLSQILTNLINNGVEACASSGGVVTVSLRKLAGSVELRVGDIGCGIPPENLGRIFDPLFTTKPFGKGTGLGLSIVHDLVGEFKGTIAVESRPGETTFIVTFPMERRNP